MTLPDIRVEMAEDRLRFFAVQVLRRNDPAVPDLTLRAEDFLIDEDTVLNKVQPYIAAFGLFWEREGSGAYGHLPDDVRKMVEAARIPRSMFEASTFSRENAIPPEGYKAELVRRPLTAETLPDIRVALAERRLLFVEAEYSLKEGEPGKVIRAGNFPFDLEALWLAFAETMNAAGYFWELDEWA